MPRYNIREDNPVKYTQVKAEQERLRAGVSRCFARHFGDRRQKQPNVKFV